MPDPSPAEMLRRRYYQLSRTACVEGPLIAAASLSRERPFVLTCWQTGSAARFVLTAAGSGRELPLAEADAVLLSLLDAPDAEITPIDVRRSIRQARAVIRRKNVVAGRPHITARLAGIVHAWLRERPHASDADIATAERILCGVSSIASADEYAIVRLLAESSSDDVIRRAATLIGDGAAHVHDTRPIDTKLIALIVLAPTATPA